MIQKILATARLTPESCAEALDISSEVFHQILSGQRELPQSLVPILSAVLGVKPEYLLHPRSDQLSEDVTPAIWYKFRGDRLTDADRECVLAVRQLAYYQHELEQLTQAHTVGWRTIFEEVRRNTDPQEAPRQQGASAARLFRSMTTLGKGAGRIGEVFRGHLRALGVLVIESPIADSQLEGCSFFVGPVGRERPCLFANSYRSTWFRRNRILLHELGHAIFDVESATASLDFQSEDERDEVVEQRADAFAQECLVPREVLRHWSHQRGVKWESLSREMLADLVAYTHAEQRTVVRALVDSSLITPSQTEELDAMDIGSLLPALSDHALSTYEFIKKIGANAAPWLRRRTTTTAPCKLLLPSRYVDAVRSAYQEGIVSRGKASRMLMVEETQLDERFPLLEAAEV